MYYDDWDTYGFPGEMVYGDYVCIPDYHMDERWKRDNDIPEYFVSTNGRVWSTISNSFIYGSPTGKSGHLDISLRQGGVRIHKYIHRMVAEAFIPNPHNLPEVRHLDDDPSNNCVWNLAWGTQTDNMRDAIRNGHFRFLTDDDRELAMQKRRDPVIAVNLRTRKEHHFESQREAAISLGTSQGSINKVLCGKASNANGYYFYRPKNGCPIDLNSHKHSRHLALIRAIDMESGDEFIFRGQTEAAKELGMSVASISMCLSGKMLASKGYQFEYVTEERNHAY